MTINPGSYCIVFLARAIIYYTIPQLGSYNGKGYPRKKKGLGVGLFVNGNACLCMFGKLSRRG